MFIPWNVASDGKIKIFDDMATLILDYETTPAYSTLRCKGFENVVPFMIVK